ncbi:hypothetical protein [Streptomyces sp. NBC_00239]|uniref:hypothetical protein n=1 Tax=Streptomyces sp. NBC_00239 TaxID=2903640 RepID=UPI002E2B14AB|nr:hypothetical protein [Streptomyces sp. NBC_00239]
MRDQYATAGDHFGHTLARQGLTVSTRNNWSQGGDVVVVSVDDEREIRIADADGWTHRSTSEWDGGRAVVCFTDEDSGSAAMGEVLYESYGHGDFAADSARLMCAVLVYVRRNGHPAPSGGPAEVDEAMALAHLALCDAEWRPEVGQDPQDWHDELRASHAAYLDGKAVAVGLDQLDTLRNAAAAGRFDLTPYADLSEALDAVRHGCMATWRATPYGKVWVDDAA